VTDFVLSPPEAQTAQYNLTVGQVLVVQQYLEGLVKTYVAPVFQANVLGPLGGQRSGGLVVSRTVGQWIDGDTSLLLVCMSEVSTSFTRLADKSR